jgi:hypothetical protein
MRGSVFYSQVGHWTCDSCRAKDGKNLDVESLGLHSLMYTERAWCRYNAFPLHYYPPIETMAGGENEGPL